MSYNTKMIRVYTRDLQNPIVIKSYQSLGFQHIRRIICLDRFPTIGTLAEISCIPVSGSKPIDSREGRSIIQKMSYI